MSERSAPNLVLVVLDALRADALPSDGPGLAALPAFRLLREESAVFPRCLSVAHWTVPSHASMWTGLYPWQHGLHHEGRGSLAAGAPLIARDLGRIGYSTGLFAANGNLNPRRGWLDGYDYAAWGCSAYLRSSVERPPPNEWPHGTRSTGRPGPFGPDGAAVTYPAVVLLERFPVLLDAMARFEHRLRGDPSRTAPALASWIEPSFRAWLSAIPMEAPAFATINLMDAHEPYLLPPGDRRRAGRVRQDHHGWIAGAWHPSADESEVLEDLHRRTVRLLDDRIGRIVRALQDAGRWQDTWLIITSDHGQSFGRDGGLFHMVGTSDDLLRVPLWMRRPGGRGAPVGRGWASLVDIPATFRRIAGLAATHEGPGVDLETLIDGERGSAVLALDDGPTFGDAADRFRGRVARRIPPRSIIGVVGSVRADADLGGGAVRYRSVDGPAPAPEAATRGLLERSVRSAVNAASEPVAGRDAEVTGRLRAWGYLD